MRRKRQTDRVSGGGILDAVLAAARLRGGTRALRQAAPNSAALNALAPYVARSFHVPEP